MKTKHTQGPWWFARGIDKTWDIGSGDEVLAVVARRSLSLGFKAGGGDEANARVIAAAPELLDCMRSLLWRFDLVGEDAEDSAVVKALAVLAKVEGVRP